MPVTYPGVQYSGIWTMQQVNAAIAAGTWPTQPAPTLFGWGRNTAQYPALGLNNTTNYSSPKQTGSGTKDWLHVSAGTGFTIAIKENNTLWAWGYNVLGALGTSGAGSYVSSPVQVGALTNWLTVSSGYSYNLAIKTDGTLWSWGYNAQGQIGDGTQTYRNSPVQVGSETIWAYVGCGNKSSYAIKTDGTLWSWGQNNIGQLGLGNTTYYSSPKQIGALTNWLNVAGGYYHAVAVKTNGTIWAWGQNTQGQLGQGNTINRSSPVQVGALTTWSKTRAIYFSCFGIRSDGTLWSWGQNAAGQLGLGNTTYYSSPKQIGSNTNWASLALNGGQSASGLAITTSGTLWAWGAGNYGKLGLGNTTYYSVPKQVGTLTSWTKVSQANNHTMAIAMT
jgi:alpha-tubulin suppressor-like RCC1 family protein